MAERERGRDYTEICPSGTRPVPVIVNVTSRVTFVGHLTAAQHAGEH